MHVTAALIIPFKTSNKGQNRIKKQTYVCKVASHEQHHLSLKRYRQVVHSFAQRLPLPTAVCRARRAM